MQDHNSTLPSPNRTPWNKGKLIGAKPPLLARHVWSIRTRLQIERRTRDLAMFNLAIDSKLRGCDVVALRDVAGCKDIDAWTESFDVYGVSKPPDCLNVESLDKHHAASRLPGVAALR